MPEDALPPPSSLRVAPTQIATAQATPAVTTPSPSPPPHGLGLMFGLCLAIHVLLAARLGLSVDEAHYALYGQQLALSYFDHPPLVGWVQAPFVFLGGADWMLRVMPTFLWCLTAWMLWRFSKWALILFLLSPMYQLLGLALLPDSLLLPLTLWVMALVQRMVQAAPAASAATHAPATGTNIPAGYPPTTDWLCLGVALGLAGLSKYTGISLALGVALVLLAHFGWTLFRQRGLWLCALVAALMISPVLIWNAQHDWMSFSYQLKHAGGAGNTWGVKPVLASLGIQVLVYGLMPCLGLWAAYTKLRNTQNGLPLRMACAFGVPLLLTLALLAGQGASLPHWSAPAWIALLPAAGQGLEFLCRPDPTSGTRRLRPTRKLWLSLLAGIQALSLLVLCLAMLTGGYKLKSPGNPFADFYDWEPAAQKAQGLQKKYQFDALAVGNWVLASRLAWYGRERPEQSPPRVWALDGKNKQFDLWFGTPARGVSFLWVDWSQMPLPAPASAACQPLEGEQAHYVGKHSSFSFYRCSFL